jgi:hypothetical protein
MKAQEIIADLSDLGPGGELVHVRWCVGLRRRSLGGMNVLTVGTFISTTASAVLRSAAVEFAVA